MPNAAIEFEFKGNLAQLRRDLNEASRLAKQSAGDVSRTTERSGFTDLFRRTPERRAERALSGLGTALATGDLATGLATFSERLSGLGLAAGVGVGVAVGLFEKFREDINKANESAAAFREELSKPISVLGALGPEELTSQLGGFRKAGEQRAQDRRSIGAKFRDFVIQSVPGGAGVLEKGDKEEAEAYEKGLAARSRLRAEAELKIANLKLQSVTTSEKDAALAKIAADAEEKRAKLKLERSEDPNLKRSIEAVNIEEQAARTELEKKFKTKQDEANVEAYILSLKDQGLTKEQQQTEETRTRIRLLQSQLAGATNENKLEIQNKLTPLQQQIASLPFDQKTFPEKMEAIKAEQVRRANFKEDWFKRRNQATDDYYRRRDEATALYDQARYGYQSTTPADTVRTSEAPISDAIGTQIKSGIDQLNQKMDQYWS